MRFRAKWHTPRMSDKTVMPWNDVVRRGVKILCALFIVLGAVVSVSVETQHTAEAASCLAFQSQGDWHVPFGCSNVRIASGNQSAHHCIVVGKSADGKTQGVECADLYVTNTKTVGDIWGEGEFSCSGAHPQCLGMNVEVWVSEHEIDPASTAKGAYECTTSGCPNGHAADVSTSHLDVGQDCFSAYSFELPDGQNFERQDNHDVLSINGASSASHAVRENDSYRVTVCLDKPSS
jgi:hypothetical protein